MAGIRIEVTSRLFIKMVRLSRSVSTLAVAQKAPKTGSLLPFDKTEMAERNIRIFPLKDSGSGSYTLIWVPLAVLISFGQSSDALLKLKDRMVRKSRKNRR